MRLNELWMRLPPSLRFALFFATTVGSMAVCLLSIPIYNLELLSTETRQSLRVPVVVCGVYIAALSLHFRRFGASVAERSE